MRTLVALENSNCGRCHRVLLGELRSRERVQHVWSDFSTGCLVIEHEDDDPAALVSLIRTVGRAVAAAGNGERVMVTLDGHEAAECPVSKSAVHPRFDEASLTVAPATSPATSPGGSGCPGSASPSGTRSPPPWRPMASLSEPGSGLGAGRGGVRVLSRERPAPGLVLRAVRFFSRMFRVVFRVPR